MEIEKAYFTLPELLERWAIAEADLIYLAENDRLRLSVRVFGLPVEFGDHEQSAQGEWLRIPLERQCFSGLLDLYAHDAFRLFRAGEVSLTEFRTPVAAYASLRDEAGLLHVIIGDLLVRREERDRFERETGFRGAPERGILPPQLSDFRASPDYHEVHCAGHNFRLGPIQAQVVRALHEAARTGAPWVSGKSVLAAAGSRSLRMADVFKSQLHWRHLILSNRRGDYRLNGD